MISTSKPAVAGLASNIAGTKGGENLEACLTCGQCVSRCFLMDAYSEMNPRKLIRKVLTGRHQDLVDDDFIWACTLCSRCTTDCPKDLNMDVIVRHIRSLAYDQGKAPERIVTGIDQAEKTGNNLALSTEVWIDTAEWLGEEVEEELGFEEGELQLPIDKEGAELLYIPNPREYTSNPKMFQTYLTFFNYVGADWTLSSKVFDITNWAYYMGRHDVTVKLVRNLVEETRRLGAKALLSTECGHGFKILRKDAEGWLGEPLGFEVLSVVELAHRYFKEGRLNLRKDAVKERVTYHDPCNVGRKLGIFEPPRELLKHIAEDFVELWPSGKFGVCCGGGGSVGQNKDMATKRLETAKRKHDQIIATEASILATCCQNCLSQLQDLQSRYDMPVQVKSVMEMVVEAAEAPDRP
jgi:Fe-S oxidoreductase